MEESKRIEYPANAESGIVNAQFLLQEITRKLNTDHHGFTTIATQQTHEGQGRNISRLVSVTTIINKAIKNKIMQWKRTNGEDVPEIWNAKYYDNISQAIPNEDVLNSIIEELKQNQTIKDIIKEAKEEHDPEVLITSVTTDQNAGRKMRKSRHRHRKSNKKHRKGNKKHKKSIKKHRK